MDPFTSLEGGCSPACDAALCTFVNSASRSTNEGAEATVGGKKGQKGAKRGKKAKGKEREREEEVSKNDSWMGVYMTAKAGFSRSQQATGVEPCAP